MDILKDINLEALSQDEKNAVLKILGEISHEGISNTYNDILYADYEEIPVDIITFIKDDKYLGKAWHLSDGTCKLYPYWEHKLKELFPTNTTTSVNNFILSGSRGLGKSEIAITVMAYLMYRVMCLKNPREYFNLKPTEKIAFSFMNITESLAIDIGVSKFQSTIQLSPWFMSKGTLSGTKEVVWNPPAYIKIIIGSQPRHVIGQATFASFFDEISFIPTQDVEKQKTRAIDMIDTAVGGMKTRFTNNGKNPGIVILASSKRSEKSFLEEHMKKKAQSEGDNTLIVDEAVWNVKPEGTYSKEKFYVAVGNRFLSSEVIMEPDPNLDLYRNKGYRIIEVPIDLKPDFIDDIDRALCDYAGISSSELTTYISGIRLAECKVDTYENPFTKDIIEVGNAPDDTAQYWDFFDISKIPKELKSKPLYVHLDMSVSGDKTGIAGTWIIGKTPSLPDQPISKDLYFQLAFSVSVKAPRGYQISFEKNRQFIRWLRDNGFRIRMVSCFSGDTLIATPTGNKSIKDFKSGDLVLSYNHELKKVEPAVVSELLLQGTEDKFINIETEFGDIIECTYDHPILTQRGYVMAKDLTLDDEIIFDDHTIIKNRLLKTNYFIDNEYLDKYVDICVSGLEVMKEKYVHDNHHIVPRFYFKNSDMPIDNSKNNITTLTYRQHAMAHWYLLNCAVDGTVKYNCLRTLMLFFNSNVIHELTDDMLQKFEKARQEYAILAGIKNKGNKGRTGQITPPETRLKQSKSNMYIHRKENLSANTIELMRKNHSGGGVVDWSKYSSEYRKQALGKGSKGSHWYTNGKNNIKLFDKEPVPEGYHAGRCGMIGRIFVNNGKIQMKVKSDDIPEGFIRGKLKINKSKKRSGVLHHSLETRKKISESVKKYWQLKRQGNQDEM